ncbi:histidine kinase [Hyphomicrobium sp.]|uniref:sensor histidine kinase n=1 Tax=Hyphomicrobium sp. TaxID=82 RepID=UPI000FAE60DD|nr:histidine kinase [Hyphomicrobium sp.]RUO99224.1 MAG: HAMP domain-containing protein [Hyphomicrobium sp.]
MSLRQRLLINVALVLFLSVIVGALTTYWRAAAKIETELHSAFVVGEQILEDGVNGLNGSPNPYHALIGIIEQFNSARHLKVSIVDKGGERAVQSHIETPSEPAPEWFYNLLAGSTESAHVKLPPEIHGYSAFLIETDPRNEVQEVWEDVGNSLLLVGLLAALVSALIYWTVGRELKPLEQLGDALLRGAEGDFSTRVEERGARDIRAVTSVFNHMAAKLEQAEAAKTLLEEQLSSVQEEERAELARDLHDEIGPLLFSVGLDAAAVQNSLGDNQLGDAADRLESIREAVGLSQRRVLQILGRLRTGTVEDLGLEAAVQRLVEFWTARKPGLEITTTIPEGGVGVELDSVVYRIVQESISNAVRHGKTTTIDAAVKFDDSGLSVHVVDDGGGLKSSRAGHGLTGMRERVMAKRGRFNVRNRPDGRGTIVEARFGKATEQHHSLAGSHAGSVSL